MPIAIPVLDGIISIGGKLIDRLIPDKEAAAAAKLKLLELQQAGELEELRADTQLALGQLEINKIEAGSSSFFVAAGRPAIVWICGFSLAFQYIIGPLGEWITGVAGLRITWPHLNNAELTGLLVGLLGLGGMRTAEKLKGVARDTI